MSPCYKRPSLAIHFTWKQDWPSVQKVLPMIERELAPFEVGHTGASSYHSVGAAPAALRDVR